MEGNVIQQAGIQELSLPVAYAQNMTPAVARKVTDLKSTIDIHDKGKIIAFGREEQASLGKFYDSIIQGVGTKEMGEAGALLTQVIGDIQGYNASCDKEAAGLLDGLFGFLKKQKNKLKTLQIRYKSLADNMETVVKELQNKDLELGKLSRNFDAMYEENLATYEFLTMVIFAGEQALEEEKQKLVVMQQKAQESGDLMEVQKASDFNDDIIRFERRLYDLKATRTLALQQAPQIKNIQKSADEISESIKTVIVTSIPLWKSQMALALGMQTVREGLNAVNAVKDATNAMLIANSQMNKQLTLEAAQAVERGAIDIETINIVNNNLIDSLNGSYEIAQNAITTRKEGAKQLQEKENELKATIAKYTNLN